MIKDFIQNNFLRSSTIAGVECVLNSSDETEFRFVILQKKKGKIIIQSSAEGIESEKALFNKISTAVPICLTLNGKNIIHKKLEAFTQQDDASLLQKILPGASLNDFYLQKKSIPSKGNCFVSVIRKNILDDYLQKFIRANYYVLNCSLGPFSVEEILPLLTEFKNGDEFSFDGFTLKFTQNKITDLLRNIPSPNAASLINLSTGSLSEKLILSFSLAFEYFIDRQNASLQNPAFLQLKEEFNERKKFQFYGWSCMIFFFILLLINYFLFSYYSATKETCEAKIALNQGYIKKYESLQKEITEKKQFIETTGLLEASRTSYYADQIAIDLPNSIMLTDLNIQPVNKKFLTDENKISFTPKVISVSGNCKKSYELNEWMKVLSKKSWLQNVSIMNYFQDNEDGLGKFTLEVHIR